MTEAHRFLEDQCLETDRENLNCLIDRVMDLRWWQVIKFGNSSGALVCGSSELTSKKIIKQTITF